jgi:putative endonuclease
MGVANIRGRAGEALAAAYLELAGCDVLARNHRLAGVEVDVVAREARCRVVVEVKLRNRGDYGGAAAAVDVRKQSRLLRAAQALVGDGAGPVRIDVITVELESTGARIVHYRDAIHADG